MDIKSDPKAIFAIQHQEDQSEVVLPHSMALLFLVDLTSHPLPSLCVLQTSGWNPDLNFIYTSNLFQSYEVALDQGNNFAIVGKYLFVARALSRTHVALWVSTDGGKGFDRARLSVSTN